jgi:hypothetical protein
VGKLRTIFLVLALLALGPVLIAVSLVTAHWRISANRPGVPQFTIGKETTLITGPLDEDGYIDYEAALNDRLARGITPETNANVLLWKAQGPHPDGEKMPPGYFLHLGIEEPPEDGDYFVRLQHFVPKKAKPPPPGPQQPETVDEADDLTRAIRRPWAARELPLIAEWLEANEKPLALVIEASKRPQYYNPVVMRPNRKGLDGFITAPTGNVQQCRELAAGLAARAMQRVNAGKFEDAWQDLLAAHRLGRLVGRGGTLIIWLVGTAIDQIAGHADLTFLERAQLTPEKAQACLRDLERLPAIPPLHDKVDLAERFNYLYMVLFLNRAGIGSFEEFRDMDSLDGSNYPSRILTNGIDWDPALICGNRAYDQMVAALRIKDRPARERELKRYYQARKALRGTLPRDPLESLKKNFAAGNLHEIVFGRKEFDRSASEKIGHRVVDSLLIAMSTVQDAADRAEQVQRNLHIAFALAVYRGDFGRYPGTLEALAPRYLERVPEDVFSGQPLIYRPAKTGYLLYSVGVNGKDEGGHGPDDEPAGDDLRVRMPLPELKRK